MEASILTLNFSIFSIFSNTFNVALISLTNFELLISCACVYIMCLSGINFIFISPRSGSIAMCCIIAVSYTHLTLPTNREV